MGYLIVASILIIAFLIWQRSKIKKKRSQFIDRFRFPNTVSQKITEKYPHLQPEHINLVTHALKEYFQVCNMAGKRMVAMPSQVVDVAWHEMILFTRLYDNFCNRAFGRFLHHTPAEAMQSPTLAQDGIKRAWRLSCVREKIDRKNPQTLPLLFDIDERLNIPDGFKYKLRCNGTGNDGYCASHIGCSSGCSGGCSGDSGSSCSGGCGGGD